MSDITDMAATDWRTRAACRAADPDLFFPEACTGIRAARKARAICAGCQVRAQCLDFALADPALEGIWAGTTGRERARLRRASAAPVQLAPVTVTERYCGGCKHTKAASEFGRNRAQRDGLTSQCKSCCAAAKRARRAA